MHGICACKPTQESAMMDLRKIHYEIRINENSIYHRTKNALYFSNQHVCLLLGPYFLQGSIFHGGEKNKKGVLVERLDPLGETFAPDVLARYSLLSPPFAQFCILLSWVRKMTEGRCFVFRCALAYHFHESTRTMGQRGQRDNSQCVVPMEQDRRSGSCGTTRQCC